MDEKALRAKIGDKKFQEITSHVQKLKAAKKSPDQIVEELRTKYPELVKHGLVDAYAPVWVLA